MTDQTLLTTALAVHESGDLALAEQQYLKIIDQAGSPTIMANAKQLLGSLYSKIGRHLDAENCMIASLAIDPNQPNVRNNLAVCYKRQGNFEQAMKNYSLAITLQPDYLAAYQNLTNLFHDYDMFSKALAVIDIALGVFPEEVVFKKQQAQALLGLRQYDRAQQVYQELHRQAPLDISISHNLAVCLRLNNNPTEALRIFENLYATAEAASPELVQNMGNAYSDLGHLEHARRCFEHVIHLSPNYVPAHENLKSILWSMGENSSFVDSYEMIIGSGESSAKLQQSYVETLLTAGKPVKALAFIDSGRSKLSLEDPLVNDFKARCLLATNDTTSAIKFHQKACDTADSATPYWIDYAITLLTAGEVQSAANILEQIFEREPTNQMVLAHLSICWRLLVDSREKRLNNYDLVGEYEIPTPRGFSQLSTFNQVLNNCLTEFHTSQHHPLEQTVRQGTQTYGNLFSRDHELLRLLQASFREVISRHVDKMKLLEAPYPGFSADQEFDFSASWSVRLKDQGYHTQHIHPMGWLSSAYYVDLPTEMEANGAESAVEDHSGWIKFGEPNLAVTPNLAAQHIVKPKVGTLLLFPSYMWHGTIPFKSEQTRTSVVFDAIPVSR